MIIDKYTAPGGLAWYDHHVESPREYIKQARKVCELVERYVNDVVKRGDIYIVYTGHSGSILAHYVLAYCNTLPVQMMPLRISKPEEVSHHEQCGVYNEDDSNGIGIIVDDFIESGETIRFIAGEAEYYGADIVAVALMDASYGDELSECADVYAKYDIIGLV